MPYKKCLGQRVRETGGVLQGCGSVCLTCLCSGAGLIASIFDIFICSALGAFAFLLGKAFLGDDPIFCLDLFTSAAVSSS